ncbi:MAG TPA: ISKra4 family transposase [Thiobacillaceae bacterium]|nr:ISKra4 family transposase [Thiobacillaceae bacterium]
MRCKVQMIMETEAGEAVQEIACLDRDAKGIEDIGLTLAEAKTLLLEMQQAVVRQQLADYLKQRQNCPECGKACLSTGAHSVVFRTLFGNLELHSPRLFHCTCQPHDTLSFSPLTELLGEHTAPERLYLETKWASRVSFDMTAKLLAGVLPLDAQLHAASIRNHLQQVTQRTEAELGAEQFSFIDGCPREWGALPRPPVPPTIGIDGGYVRQWDNKQTHFEVIVGKSMPEEGPNQCFGFVQTYDEKPKRRLFELLKSQGMQMNQQVTCLSDGGDDVRDLQLYLNPEADHYLDWFHVTMRLTVMGQSVKGLPEKIGEAEDERLFRAEAGKRLESLKWYLWHGNVFRALDEIEALEMMLAGEEALPESGKKLTKAIGEFHTYIPANERFIPNYGERWRNGDLIAAGFVESTVNEVVSKRMVKKQQMQWTPRGAHLLLQARTKVLNDELDQTFRRWYPNFRKAKVPPVKQAA